MSLIFFLFIVRFVYCQFENGSGIPVCAANCSSSTFNAIGCSAAANTTTQWTCICARGHGFFVSAVPCFAQSCNSTELQDTSNWFTTQCATVNVVPPPFSAILNGQVPPPPPHKTNITSTVYTVPSVIPTTQVVVTTISPSASTAATHNNTSVSSNSSDASISGGAIGGIVAGVIGAGAVVIASFILFRRAKRRRFLRPSRLELLGIGDDEPKSPALRYPSPDLGRESNYSANLSTDTRPGLPKGNVAKSEHIIEESQ